MTEERKYIYSIIRNPQGTQAPLEIRCFGHRQTPLSVLSPGQASDTFRLSETILGINNRDTIFIPYKDMAAVVSNIHLINFDKLDEKELTQLVAIHERVNSDLMKKHNVIPMRFGMVAESTEEIRNILAKAYIQFKTALERIAGKAEFIVQVFWNERNILEKLLRENIEIQELKKEAESRGKILGFSSKIKLGKRIFEAIEARRKEYIADILGNLATCFPNFSAGKLLDKEILINHSFLIDMTEELALEPRLNQLAEKYKDDLKFKYIGPMAPYSFAVINLEVGNFNLVDNARKILGLGESAAFSEIKNAYRKLAHEYHPDKQFFTKDQVILEKTEKKMKDIITANEILTVYCKHYLSALAPKKEQLCSFRKEDVEDSIIIKDFF